MAKYKVTYSCGHEGTVELLGKEKDRQRTLEWYERTGLCPECYKAKKKEEVENTPLMLNVKIEPFQQQIVLIFTGNTMPVKDRIKEKGYRWGELPTAGLNDIFSMKVEKGWHKEVSIKGRTEEEIQEILKNELTNVKELEPKLKNEINPADLVMLANARLAEQERQEKIDSIPKPEKPEVLLKNPGKWNGTVYGKSGNKQIYIDNKKVTITDEEAKAIEEYLKAKEEYKKKIAEIK